jgi:hypothetical protein
MADPSQPIEGVQYGGPTKKLGRLSPEDEPIYGGTIDPSEHILAGSGSTGMTPPPGELFDYLPALIRAASDPNAPAGLNVLLDMLDMDQQNAIPPFGRHK